MRRTAVIVLAVLLVVLTALPGLRRQAQQVTSGAVTGVHDWFAPRDAALDRERTARMKAEQQAAGVSDAAGVVAQARAISTSYAASGRRIITARVIAYTPYSAASGARRVQLDSGSDAGVETNEAVVAPGGLIGRVTAVSPSSATVTLLSDPASAVGARVSRTSALARIVGEAPAGVPSRSGGAVSVLIAQGGSMAKGDRVVTAGSPGGRPYPAGLPIGVITALDPDHGQLERSASLSLSADAGSVDVVGVLVPGDS